MKNFIKNLFGKNSDKFTVIENKNNVSICYLSIGSTSDTNTSNAIKRYIGVGTVKVLAVNPNAAKIEEIMGFKPTNEPEYIGTNNDGKKTARVSLVVKTVPEDCNGIDTTAFLTFNLTATTIEGSSSGKIQVMDDFGSDPAWGDADTVNAGKPIIYGDGRNPLIGQYHKVCRGELSLVKFLRAYLGVPQAQTYNNGTWTRKTGDELKKAFLHLDNIKNYFAGDFSEIKEAIELQPENKVKVLFGVRTNDEGRQYQDINSEVFMNARSNSTKQMERFINDAKANGRYANTEYDFEPIHEYSPIATDFSSVENSELPFQQDNTPFPTDNSDQPF